MAGRTTLLGYGTAHQKRRALEAKKVEAGVAYCWRCRGWIRPGSAWHLGHVDGDKSSYMGPEHARCSLRSGALIGNRSPKRRGGRWGAAVQQVRERADWW